MEGIWSNSEVVEVPASPEVEDQSAAVAEKVAGEVQVPDPLPLVEEKDRDVRSCLVDIAERSKFLTERGTFLAELVLTERRQAETGEEARVTIEKAREEMADRLATSKLHGKQNGQH